MGDWGGSLSVALWASSDSFCTCPPGFSMFEMLTPTVQVGTATGCTGVSLLHSTQISPLSRHHFVPWIEVSSVYFYIYSQSHRKICRSNRHIISSGHYWLSMALFTKMQTVFFSDRNNCFENALTEVQKYKTLLFSFWNLSLDKNIYHNICQRNWIGSRFKSCPEKISSIFWCECLCIEDFFVLAFRTSIWMGESGGSPLWDVLHRVSI